MDAQRDSRATEFDETLRWIRDGKARAWLAVNAVMIDTYDALGAFLGRKIREEGWGSVEVQKWADWLIANTSGRTGFSARNLMRMRTFHEVWTETGALPPTVRDLSWSCHLIILENCATAQERAFYLEAAVRGKWSPKELESKIRERLFGQFQQENGEK